MTTWADVIDKGFDRVKGYVDRSLGVISKAISDLSGRIDTLEKREPIKGDKGLDGERGADGAPGKDGTSGQDGKDGAPGADGKDGLPGEKGLDGQNGKDGVGLAGAIIDREGALVVTLTDGTTRELGPVVGKNGDQGEKGVDGKDGIDGVGFDDLEVVHDGERGFAFKFTRGEVVKEFKFSIPAMIYRGVFKEGGSYTAGDTVTWGGSLWHCGEDTSDKPETTKAWTLAAKRGRDGKDAIVRTVEAKPIVRVGVPSKKEVN